MSRTYRFRHLPTFPGEPEKYVDGARRAYQRKRTDEIYNYLAHELNDYPCVAEDHGWFWSSHSRCLPEELWSFRERLAVEDWLSPDFRNAVGYWHRFGGYCGRQSPARGFYKREYARRDRHDTRAILRDDRNWTDDCDQAFPDTPNKVDWEVS